MTSGKDIIDLENRDEQLRLLAAQRHLYSSEKFLLGTQIIIGIGVAIVGALVQNKFPKAEHYVVLAGAALALIDVICLESRKGKNQRLAAKIQERFDSTVLMLGWQRFKAGSEPEPEEVLENSEHIFSKPTERDKLKNWYPPEIQDLPLQPARIVCQRGNCMYESRLRSKYLQILYAILAVLTIVTFTILMLQNQKVVESVVLMVAPLIPAYVILVREIYAEKDAIERLHELKNYCNELWEKAIGKLATEKQLDLESRAIQDEIFEARRRSAVIPDWIYYLDGSKNELTLKSIATQMVNEYKSANP